MRYKEFSITEDFNYLDPNMSGGLARSGDQDAITELQTWLNDNGYDVFLLDKNCSLIPKKIANKITDANLKIIRGAGHLINIENPKIFNHYILKFLKDLTKKKKYP